MKTKNNINVLEIITLSLFILLVLTMSYLAWSNRDNPITKIPINCRYECKMYNQTPSYVNGTCKCFLSICHTYLNGTLNESSCKST